MRPDQSRPPRRRPRPLPAPVLPAGPLSDLKTALYRWYLQAGAPTLDAIQTAVAEMPERLAEEQDCTVEQVDAHIGAAPGRDTIRRTITGPTVPPNMRDVAAVAVALAYLAGALPAGRHLHHIADFVRGVEALWQRACQAPAATAGAGTDRDEPDNRDATQSATREGGAGSTAAGTGPVTQTGGGVQIAITGAVGGDLWVDRQATGGG